MTHSKKTGLVAIIFAAIAFSSCKKSDNDVSDSRYQFIKVYDDKINEIQNSNYKIAASNERYYMIFQVQLLFEYRSMLLVTDKEGEVINRDTLPSGMTISDVMVLDDGGALVAGYLGCCPYLNIFHYDKDGNVLTSYSLYIPGIDLLSLSGSPQLIKSPNGNIIVYGNYYSSSGWNPYGYLAEVDSAGNVLWSKKISLTISSCTPTSDNGYLVAGSDMDTIGNIDFYLLKTNSTGDSLFANKVKDNAAQPSLGNLVRTTRNTYQLNYTVEYPSYKSTIHETNVNGDSLNAVTFDNSRLGWLTARNDGRTMMMFSPYLFGISDAVTVRKSTRFVTVDASLNTIERFAFQSVTTDYILSTCNTPEGKVACFGVIQSFKKDYYKPVLIVLN